MALPLARPKSEGLYSVDGGTPVHGLVPTDIKNNKKGGTTGGTGGIIPVDQWGNPLDRKNPNTKHDNDMTKDQIEKLLKERDNSDLNRIGPLLEELEEKDGKKGGRGGGSGLSEERKALKPELAQRIADAYARSQKPGTAEWNDQYQSRIDALLGDRYRDYESRYQPTMDSLMTRLLNRPDFQYNWSDDPLYRQYAARYAQQARQGMQDTMGQAAALTGGYGSSYATAAGQQAYANQMAGLNDAAMQLYQLAKDRYDTQGQEMRSNLSALTGLEQMDRQNYDTDRGVYYNRQDADVANLRDSQNLAWQIYQDQAARELQERQMAWDQYQYWNNLYEQNYLK